MFLAKLILMALIVGGLLAKSFRSPTEEEKKKSYGEDFPYVIRKHNLTLAIIALVTGLLLWGCVGQVGPGQRGVVVRMGAVTGRVLPEGIYFVAPLVERVELMSVQVMALSTESSSASRDLQVVNTNITLNFQLDPEQVGTVYQTMRQEYVARVVQPAIQESVKAATALFDAESLIGRRDEVRNRMKDLLVSKLSVYGITVRDVSITNFDFSKLFNEAIEAKATALQNAETAKRNLERVKSEQQAEIEKAKAQAESLRLQKMNVTPELVNLRQIEVQKASVEVQAILAGKWNGVMPSVIAGNSGMILQMPAPQMSAPSPPAPAQ